MNTQQHTLKTDSRTLVSKLSLIHERTQVMTSFTKVNLIVTSSKMFKQMISIAAVAGFVFALAPAAL